MRMQLYSIEAAPRTLPIWELILDDLGRPPVGRIARVLGVGASTVYRWNAAGQAPRCASLALYWLTRWGRSEIHCAAVNDATAAVGYANSLYTELEQTKAQLARVLSLADTGAANGPLVGIGNG